MRTNWLWDSRLSESEAKKILKHNNDPRFDFYAEKLLSRVNNPQIVFSLMDQKTFCAQWSRIKKRIKKDQWLENRVIFWQTIYEHTHKKLEEHGIKIRRPLKGKIPPERFELAKQIRQIRIQLGFTQSNIAKKLGVIQQYVSRIETGRENVSVGSLKRVADALGKKLTIQLR